MNRITLVGLAVAPHGQPARCAEPRRARGTRGQGPQVERRPFRQRGRSRGEHRDRGNALQEPDLYSVLPRQQLESFQGTALSRSHRAAAGCPAHPRVLLEARLARRRSIPVFPGTAVSRGSRSRGAARISSIHVARPAEVLSDNEVRDAMARRRSAQPHRARLQRRLPQGEMWDEGYGDADARVDTIVVDTAAKSAAIRASVVQMAHGRGTDLDQRQRARVERDPQLADARGRPPIQASGADHEPAEPVRVELVPPRGDHRPAAGDSIKHIEITVQEAPLREIRASAGFNTYEFGQVETRLTRYNWFGGGRRLDFRAAVGNIAADALNARFPFQEVLRYRCRTPTPINTSRPPGRQAPTSRSRGSSRRETRLAPASSVTARARRASS